MIIKNILKKINVHPIFFFLAFASIITGLFKEFLVFSSIIFIHEIGHIITSIFFKWNIKKINFYPFGGYIEFDEILNKPIKEEMVIVLSGLISQIIYYFIIVILFDKSLISLNMYEMFKHYHYSILFFNIIPIYPLDGIKIVNLLLSKYFPYRNAHSISIWISIVFIIFFIIFSFTYSLSMNIILIIGLLLNQIVKEKKNHNLMCNKFIFERYLYHLDFNKTKIVNGDNLKKMYRDYKHIFKSNNIYITERKKLRERFKNY